MISNPYDRIKKHIKNGYDHIQMSDANATDPNIIAALEEILDALRILTKEADDADTVIRRMGQP